MVWIAFKLLVVKGYCHNQLFKLPPILCECSRIIIFARCLWLPSDGYLHADGSLISHIFIWLQCLQKYWHFQNGLRMVFLSSFLILGSEWCFIKVIFLLRVVPSFPQLHINVWALLTYHMIVRGLTSSHKIEYSWLIDFPVQSSWSCTADQKAFLQVWQWYPHLYYKKIKRECKSRIVCLQHILWCWTTIVPSMFYVPCYILLSRLKR